MGLIQHYLIGRIVEGGLMKVHELITKLQAMDQDLPVRYWDEHELDFVEIDFCKEGSQKTNHGIEKYILLSGE